MARVDRSWVSRRALVRTVGLAAGALAGCAPMERLFSPTAGRGGVNKRIIIVGAGLAGLACGHELKAAGYAVNLFEARGRVGGRVLSLTDVLPGTVVEAGGEFVSPNHALWTAYARRFGLTLDPALPGPADSEIIVDGKPLDPSAAHAVWSEIRSAYAALAQDAASVVTAAPWDTPDAEKLDRRTVAGWVASLRSSAETRRIITADIEAQMGVPASSASLLALLARVKAAGPERVRMQDGALRCKGGNRQLADELARSIGMARIQLRAPVVAIQSNNGVVHVSTADGRAYEADDVVLAVPPTVWEKIQIYPNLPNDLAMQMGQAVKYLAVVSGGGNMRAITTGDLSATWEATPASRDPSILVAYSAGRAAEAVRAYRLEEQTARYRQNLTHIRALSAGPLRMRYIDWVADRWTLGGASFPAPMQTVRYGPICREIHPQIHLAGEHMSFSHAGTMEGALQSGVVLARRLALRDGAATA